MSGSDWGSDSDEDVIVARPRQQAPRTRPQPQPQPQPQQPQQPQPQQQRQRQPQQQQRPQPQRQATAKRKQLKDDAAVMAVLKALQEDVVKLGDIQLLIIRKLLAGFHQGALQQLGADAKSEDPVKRALAMALAANLRKVATRFQTANQGGAPGSLATAQPAFQSFTKTIHPFLKPGGLIKEGGVDTSAGAQLSSSIANAEVVLQRLRQDVAQLKEQKKAEASKFKAAKEAIKVLEHKQATALADAKRLKKRRAELEEKKKTMDVLENGMQRLRGVMEQEMEGKIKMRQNLEDLNFLHKQGKHTWVSPSAYGGCLICKSDFQPFGPKQKTWCRSCGRMFCRDCTTKQVHQEKGYGQPVPVCSRCTNFKQNHLNK